MGYVRFDDQPVEIPSFAIVAQVTDSGFVHHIGVLQDAQILTRQSPVSVYEQAPPLRIDPSTTRQTSGWAAAAWIDLDDSDIESARIWLEHTRQQLPRRRDPRTHYCVSPPIDVIEEQGRETSRRYSCIGFVLDLYEKGLDKPLPLNWRATTLPDVDENLIIEVWPEIVDRTRGPTISNRLQELHDHGWRLGISGNGPWKVVLPGYAVTSIVRNPQKDYVPESVHAGRLPVQSA